MKKYSLIILLLTMLAICSVSFADTVQIGTGTATSSNLPIYGLYGYNYTQQIYTQAQINKAGNITKLRFFYVSGTITNSKDWVIYMGHTTKTTFSSTTDWEPLANLTQVFAGDVSSYVPLANNWMEIPLTTPFNYNNTSNLIIAVDENTSGYASMSWGAFTSGTNTGIYYYSDSVNPDPASPPTASSRTGSIDRIQLVFPNSSSPLAPTLLSPLNGGWAMIGDILSWTPTSGAGDANAYDVYFGTATNPPLVSSNQAATTYTPTLAAGTTYYWKVVAKNELGDSPASDVWSFKTPTTTQVAESFENTSFPPAGWANPGTWSRSTSYAKHGTASAYKYGSSSSQYILSTPKVTITSTSTLNFWSYCSATTGTLQILYSPDRTTWTQISSITYASASTWYNSVIDLSSLAGNNYYLGIRTGLQSATFCVDLVIGPEITPEAPGAPTLTAPANGATWISTLPTFTWTAPTTGGISTGYKVYCDTFNPPTSEIANVTGLTFTATVPLLNGTQYYWTVKAYNTAGDAAATPFSFTTVEQGYTVIGTGTSTQRQPFGTVWGYERSAALYTNAQIGGYGLLDKVAWNCAATTTTVVPYKIYAMQTNDTAFTAMSWDTFTASATLVDEGTHTFSTTGLHLFELDTPFSYVYGNLIVAVETNYGGSGGGSGHTFYYSTGAANSHQYWNQDNNPPTGNGSLNTNVPNIMLHLSELPANPNISVTPTSWDFGQVLINTTKTKDFTISNTGGGTLNVSSIVIAGNYYTLITNPAPVGLASGQSATFTVQYAPTALGTQNGTVTITDNRGVTTVNLSAVCYDPTITSAQLPYSNGFEDTWTGTPPAPVLGWTVINANTDSYTWRRGPTYIDAHTGDYIAQGMGNTDDWLITPPIQASEDLRIKWWDAVESASYPNTYTVLVSTTDNNIASFTNNLGTFTCNWTTWAEHTLSLDAFTGNTIYVAFHQTASGSTYYDFGIDDFLLEAIPAAPIFSYTPTSINFGSVQQNHPATPVNVIVTNTGGGTLNLSSSNISITGSNAAMFSFSSTNLPAALGAGQSVNIPVSVTVTQEGSVSATLTITYNSINYDVALSAEGLPAGTVIIGNGTSDLSLPIEPYYGYTYSQSIFLQSELNIAGQQINKLNYYWNGAEEATYSNNWTIYMGHTTNTSFASGTSWIPLSNLTPVFTGEVALPATAGWIEIFLTSPFAYNNTDNLVIAVDENEASYDGSDEYFYCTSATTARSISYHADDTNPDPATPPTGTTALGYPNVMLQFGELPVGAPDPVTLTYPANGATGIPQTGFNLTWTRALTGGMPTYYAVYMSQDEENIYNDYYWETANTSFNPVTEGGITFNYLERWYWTVEAVNDDGSAVVEPPHSFEIMADPRVNIPYAQDFGTAGTWPLNWTQTYSGGISSNRWSLSNTSNAGGTAYEMMASWASGTGISRLITPPINTEGITNFAVNFNTYYNDYAAGITAKVQYSFDLNTWYDASWSIISGGGDVTGNQTALITGLTNQPTTYIAWTLDGNHYQFDYWYIDDVAISLPPNHDVTVVSYDVENQVVPENTVVTPIATVGNNGVNTETFAVTCTIGTYSSTQTVSGLALGATQQVTFAPFTPALWSAESVEITTNLVGDEVPANDTFYSALICLPLNVTGLANNAQTNQFVQFNLANPGVLNALPNSYTGSYFIAGADWKNGQWLGVEYDDGTLATDNYVNIDPLTGVYTDQGDLGAAIMGNAWDDTHDIMYGVSSSGYLYVMDPATGAIGVGDSLWYNLEGTNYSLASINGLMIDIAYDNTNNILYGVDLGNDCLWTINPATYELTLVGFLGIDLNYAQDAAFDQENGLLYLAGYAGGGALYWLDTTYGGAYKVGNFTASGYELDGFAIPYGALASAPVATISGTGLLSWTPVTGAVAYNVYSADDPYGTFTLEATVRGTSYTGPSAPKKFYKVTAVGGRQQTNHQEIRYSEPIKFNGKLNQNDRYDFGPVNGFSMRSK
jgi:hypothetical protein